MPKVKPKILLLPTTKAASEEEKNVYIEASNRSIWERLLKIQETFVRILIGKTGKSSKTEAKHVWKTLRW